MRRNPYRPGLTAVTLAHRQTHDLMKLAVGQGPEADGLVVGRSSQQGTGTVGGYAVDWPRMHAGLDAQKRPLVGAGLDRIVERGGRSAVDRPLVAAGIGQPLLERLDFVGGHLHRIEPRGAARPQTRKKLNGYHRNNRRSPGP